MIKSNAILVAHDAGGAELVSLWAKDNLENSVAVLDGPAINIFKKNLPTTKVLSFNQAMSLPYPVLTGTSWQSDLEKLAIQYSLQNNKYCCTALDHWVNYKERFEFNGLQLTPNELWCFDNYALDICDKLFPRVVKKLHDNPYLSAIKTELESLENYTQILSSQSPSILYLSESIDMHSQVLHGNPSELSGYTEKEAFSFLCNCLPALFPDIKSVTVRPHPSQTISDLIWMKSYEHRYEFTISNKSSLCEQIVSHDIVIGLESMALIVAIIANKPVFSAIPPSFRRCSIPYSEIIHLSDLI